MHYSILKYYHLYIILACLTKYSYL